MKGLRDAASLPSPLTDRAAFERALEGRRPAVFLDFDGTLTPIAERPDQTRLSAGARRAVRDLAALLPLAIVSGRDREDVERLVGIEELVYAGSHGFDIRGPGGLRMEHDEAQRCLPDLEAAAARLEAGLEGIGGVLLERKRFALAAHYRNVAVTDLPAVESAVARAVAGRDRLERRSGKKVFEILPRLDWDKGKAVRWLLRALRIDEKVHRPLYVGDDLTDEDAFRELEGRGLGIVVGRPDHRTSAGFALADPAEVEAFLRELTALAGAPRH